MEMCKSAERLQGLGNDDRFTTIARRLSNMLDYDLHRSTKLLDEVSETIATAKQQAERNDTHRTGESSDDPIARGPNSGACATGTPQALV